MVLGVVKKFSGDFINQKDSEDGLRDLGARFVKSGDGRPRFYISIRCVNAISELLEYNVEVKERDHAVDGIRYGIALKSTAPLAAFRFG